MDIELLIKQTLRSIERGLGPPTLKDAFTVEDLASVTCHPHSGPSTTPTTAPWPPSSAAGGCYGASNWRPPNGNTFGSKPHHSAEWRSLRFPATRPTPLGCASPGPTHACVPTALCTYVLTTPWSSTSSGLRRREAPWAPRNPFYFLYQMVAPSPTRRRSRSSGPRLKPPEPS